MTEASKQICELKKGVNKNKNHIDNLLSKFSQLKIGFKSVNQMKKEKNDYHDPLLWCYNSKYDFQFLQLQGNQMVNMSNTIYLQIETKHNWIEEYLDRNDTIIKGYKNNKQIVVFFGEEEELCYHQKGKNEEKRLKLSEFHEQNKQIQVFFTKHTIQYRFQSNIVRMKIEDEQVLGIIEIGEQKTSQMNRILIFRYDLGVRRFLIHDGFYSDQNNLKSFKFRKGMYLLMPTSGTNFNIFFNPEYKVSFQKAKREEIRQLNLMIGAFKDCNYRKQSTQFLRQTDFNLGIIVEIYRNVYGDRVTFSEKEVRNEDIKIMFPTLYSKRLKNYNLKPYETVIQFYEISKIPAVLYIPQKTVKINNSKNDDLQSIHTILK